MKLKTFILIFFAGGFLLTACQKNVDVFVPDPGQSNGPDTSWHATVTATMPVSLLKVKLLAETYVDSINVNANVATLLTPSGLQVIFPPNSCVNSVSQPVTGRVQVEVQLVKKKGDMIRMNLPTTNNDSLLVAAGHIFIKLKKDGQTLQLAPNIKLYIRFVDLPANQSMKLFVGDETNAALFNWQGNPDLLNNTVLVGSQAYEIYTNRLRWISISYPYNFAASAKVSVTAGLSAYFTNANTVAFTVLKDFRSVSAMHGDISSRKFISEKVPVGKAVTVVVISKLGNDYFLGYENSVTQLPVNNASSHVVNVIPVKKSLSEILSYLSSL